MSKLLLIGVGATAYVLGARAGRERYEQIARSARRLRSDPRVQDTASKAADFAREKAPEVKDQVVETARDAAHKVGSNGNHTAGTDPVTGVRR